MKDSSYHVGSVERREFLLKGGVLFTSDALPNDKDLPVHNSYAALEPNAEYDYTAPMTSDKLYQIAMDPITVTYNDCGSLYEHVTCYVRVPQSKLDQFEAVEKAMTMTAKDDSLSFIIQNGKIAVNQQKVPKILKDKNVDLRYIDDHKYDIRENEDVFTECEFYNDKIAREGYESLSPGEFAAIVEWLKEN